jgi:hypothetical protein
MPTLLRPAIRRIANPSLLSRRAKSFSSAATTTSASYTDEDGPSTSKLFNPTEEHAALREMVRSFAEREVSFKSL